MSLTPCGNNRMKDLLSQPFNSIALLSHISHELACVRRYKNKSFLVNPILRQYVLKMPFNNESVNTSTTQEWLNPTSNSAGLYRFVRSLVTYQQLMVSCGVHKRPKSVYTWIAWLQVAQNANALTIVELSKENRNYVRRCFGHAWQLKDHPFRKYTHKSLVKELQLGGTFWSS